jgi:hypothetical protein
MFNRLLAVPLLLTTITVSAPAWADGPSAPIGVRPSIPVPVIELRGDAAAIGAEHGRRLGPAIRMLFNEYLPKIVGDSQHYAAALQAAQRFAGQLRPEHFTELQALAAAAGIDPRQALLGQCFLDLTAVSACSTITLPASAAPDHVARFGRNLDFPAFDVADKYSALLVYHPTGRFQFAAVGWPGLIGVLSGMNEHGLCLANMEVPRPQRAPSAMPYTLLYRTVLEHCKTVAEAIDLLQITPRQTANNLMLMDATGDRAVVEITPDRITVRRAPPGAALICTNHQRGQDLDTPGFCPRFDFLHKAAAGDFGHLGLSQVQSMLGHVGQGDFTLQSMVFEPANRVIYLAAGADAAHREMRRIDLNQYFNEADRGQ